MFEFLPFFKDSLILFLFLISFELVDVEIFLLSSTDQMASVGEEFLNQNVE